MNRWQLFVGLLLAFLFIPQKASAECAWVMWSKVETAKSQKGVFEQKLLARDAHLFDFFGTSVDVQDDAVVVGAWGESRNNDVFAGAAYVFRYNGTTWKQEQKLIASDAEGNDHFGNSVSMSDDMILVGARFDNPACPTSLNCNSGSAYLFQHNGHNRWIEKGWLRPTDMTYQDNFGQGVALSGNRAVIRALNNVDAGPESGSAYIYFALSDCEENGRLDLCDLFFDPELDSDGDGILDVCEPPSVCSADLDGDGVVNAADLAQLLGSWGPCEGCPALSKPAERASEGRVDSFRPIL